MARFSFSGNKKHKKKQNHASEYLPYLINELADEIEVVEQVLSGGEEGQVLAPNSNGKAQWAEASEIVEQALSGGEEGQVLTADSAGKAKWSAPVGGSGGVFYDEIVLSNILGETQNCTTVTLLLNGTQITGDAWIIYSTSDENDQNIDYEIVGDGAMDIYSGAPGRSPYTLHIWGAYGAVVSINLENNPPVDPGSPG